MFDFKIMQKRQKCKKGQKCISKIHTKKVKMQKKKHIFQKAHFLECFCFYIPVPFLAFSTSKFMQDKMIMQKKANKIFKFEKYVFEKRSKIFRKKHAKKAEMLKKFAKKAQNF